MPAGETWTIQQVYIEGGYFNGNTGPATSVNVAFYFDSSLLPGTAVPGGTFSNVAMQDSVGNFVISLPSALVIPEGLYWISVQANMDLSTAGRWGWKDSTFAVISGAAWRNPGGGFGLPCIGWGRRAACYSTSDPDQSFALLGTTVGGPTPTPIPTATPTGTPTPVPINPGNILVSFGHENSSFNVVREFTPVGSLVQTILFNYNNGIYPLGEELRDIVVDQAGSIAGYNGTFDPFLTRFSSLSGTFTHTTLAGWSTVNGAFGCVTAYQTFVFATDMFTFGGGQPNGIVRFDTSNNSAVRFADGADFIEVNIGLDGYLYALTDTTEPIRVYNPVTMALVRQIPIPTVITVSEGVRALAVDQGGRIFVCDTNDKVYRLSSHGAVEASKSTGFVNLSDMDIDETGRLIISSYDARVIVGDSGLQGNFTSFPINSPTGALSISFARPLPAAFPPTTPTPTPTATATVAPTATPGATPIGNGKIAFKSFRTGSYEIYVMDPGGSNQTRLTFNSLEDADPAWSRDGTKIAFASRRDGNNEIYVMDANGSNQIRLTNAQAEDSGPTWSPDGTKIAFSSARSGITEIWLMDANGANQIRLTNNATGESGLAWSPDGSKIAFFSTRQGLSDIYTVDANGSNEIRLTDTGDNFYPAWSPDGARIAFASTRDGNSEIYSMLSHGSDQINLTNNPSGDFAPAWSPDGFKIAFESERDSNAEIYVMDANGLNQINVTNNPAADLYPDWARTPALAPPTPSPTLTPVPTPSPTLTPTPTPTPSLSATPAAQTVNLSTRMRVQTGDNIGIGGFIISGTTPKHVLVRAIGPSLTQFGVPNALPDPVLELHGAGTFLTITNNNWQDDPAQEALIQATGLAPSNNLESAIDANLGPGAYTAVVRGNNNSEGVALIEVFDLNQGVLSKLVNISTRAFVSTGDDIVIAGFILGNQSGNDRIVVRGIGPSLTAFGVSDALADPTLELHDSNGSVIIGNNDWQDDPVQATELSAAGLAPSNPLECGIAATLPPGAYTALLAGRDNGQGNGVVEVYDRGAP